MLQPLDWDEEETLTGQRLPEPVAKTLRGFDPHIRLKRTDEPARPERRALPDFPRPPMELDWDDAEAITQQCTPFFDPDGTLDEDTERD